MHAISSYRGDRPTNTCHPPARPPVANTQTYRQDRLQYTAPLSLARSVITDHSFTVNFLAVTTSNLNVSDDTYAMWTTPFAFRCLLKFRFKTDEVIRTWAGIAQNYFTALLTHFAVVLVVSLCTNHIAHTCTETNHSPRNNH